MSQQKPSPSSSTNNTSNSTLPESSLKKASVRFSEDSLPPSANDSSVSTPPSSPSSASPNTIATSSTKKKKIAIASAASSSPRSDGDHDNNNTNNHYDDENENENTNNVTSNSQDGDKKNDRTQSASPPLVHLHQQQQFQQQQLANFTPKSALKKKPIAPYLAASQSSMSQQGRSLNSTQTKNPNASTTFSNTHNNSGSLMNLDETGMMNTVAFEKHIPTEEDIEITYEYGDLFAFEFLANARSSTGGPLPKSGTKNSAGGGSHQQQAPGEEEIVPWAWGVGRQILKVTRADEEERELRRKYEEDNLDAAAKLFLDDTRKKQKAVLEQGKKRVMKLELWEVEGREDRVTKGERARVAQLRSQIAGLSQDLISFEGQKKAIDDVRHGAELAISGLENALALDFGDVQDLLTKARRSLTKLKTEHFAEMRNYAKPPATVKQVLECCLIALGDLIRDSVPWEQIKIAVRSEDFVLNIRDFEPSQLSQTAMKLLQNRMKDEAFTLERARNASVAAGPLFEWVVAQLECGREARRSKAYFDLSKQIVSHRNRCRTLWNEASMITPKILKLTSSILALQSEIDKILFGNDSISFAKNVILNTDGRKRTSSHTGLLLSSPFNGLTFVPQENAPVVDMLKVACHCIGKADQLEPYPIVKLDTQKCQTIRQAFDLPKVKEYSSDHSGGADGEKQEDGKKKKNGTGKPGGKNNFGKNNNNNNNNNNKTGGGGVNLKTGAATARTASSNQKQNNNTNNSKKTNNDSNTARQRQTTDDTNNHHDFTTSTPESSKESSGESKVIVNNNNNKDDKPATKSPATTPRGGGGQAALLTPRGGGGAAPVAMMKRNSPAISSPRTQLAPINNNNTKNNTTTTNGGSPPQLLQQQMPGTTPSSSPPQQLNQQQLLRSPTTTTDNNNNEQQQHHHHLAPSPPKATPKKNNSKIKNLKAESSFAPTASVMQHLLPSPESNAKEEESSPSPQSPLSNNNNSPKTQLPPIQNNNNNKSSSPSNSSSPKKVSTMNNNNNNKSARGGGASATNFDYATPSKEVKQKAATKRLERLAGVSQMGAMSSDLL